jgi:hypothetical protein
MIYERNNQVAVVVHFLENPKTHDQDQGDPSLIAYNSQDRGFLLCSGFKLSAMLKVRLATVCLFPGWFSLLSNQKTNYCFQTTSNFRKFLSNIQHQMTCLLLLTSKWWPHGHYCKRARFTAKNTLSIHGLLSTLLTSPHACTTAYINGEPKFVLNVPFLSCLAFLPTWLFQRKFERNLTGLFWSPSDPVRSRLQMGARFTEKILFRGAMAFSVP